MSGLMSTLSSFTEGPRRYVAVGVGVLIVLLAGYSLFSRDDGLNDNPLRDVIRAGNKGNVKKLLEFTKDSDINKATEALTQLARVQHAQARPLMEQMLSDPRTEMRAAAAHQMSVVGDGKNCAVLVGALSDPEPSVRVEVCKALGNLRAESSALAMLTLVETDRPEVRKVALDSANKAMGVVFAYNFRDSPEQKRKVMANMRKFASVLAGKANPKPLDITKNN